MVMMTVVRAINHRNSKSGRTRGSKRNMRRKKTVWRIMFRVSGVWLVEWRLGFRGLGLWDGHLRSRELNSLQG